MLSRGLDREVIVSLGSTTASPLPYDDLKASGRGRNRLNQQKLFLRLRIKNRGFLQASRRGEGVREDSLSEGC